MIPLVIDELRADLVDFGLARWYIEDTFDRFVIERIPPYAVIDRLEID